MRTYIVPLNPTLSILIQESHTYMQSQLGPSHALLDLRHSDASVEADNPEDTGHLHISLTRPFTVRSSERDDYVKIARAELQKLKTNIDR